MSMVAEALVHVARKRGLLDRAGCARLGVLMGDAQIETVEDSRRFLERSGRLDSKRARKLAERLPPANQASFGPYAPLVHLADGGMGSVWLAGDANGRLVVVKTMRGNLAGNQEVAYRFERETRYMMELRHPRVVACIDHGAADDGTLFMVLEFEPSGDLKELVQAEGWLPEALALAIVHQVADALSAARERQLIHRDIKPANIFCTRDGDAKLADFGIARSTAENRTMLTMQGALVGSPYYMSPEQVIADPDLDIRSDLYAVGAVLYYCLCGMDPYRGNLNEVLHAHRTAPIPDVRQVRPEVSTATAAIVVKCMQKKREDRFATPADLAAALVEALARLDGAQPLTAMPRHDPGASTIAADLSGGDEAASAGDPPTGATKLKSTHATVAAPGAPDLPTIALSPAEARGEAGNAVVSVDPGATVAFSPSEWSSGAAPPSLASQAETARIATNHLHVSAAPPAAANLPPAQPTNPPAPRPPSTRPTSSLAPRPPAQRPVSEQIARPAATPTPAGPAVEGDLNTAFANPWLALVGTGHDQVVLLWARTQLALGKLCEPPVDLCLRKYPVSQFRDDCLKISRNHLRLRYDSGLGRPIVTDLGSGNGTTLDGATLAANATKPLEPGREHLVNLANVLELRVKAIARREPPVGLVPGLDTDAVAEVGLNRDHRIDAVTMQRTGNRPGMAYALVLRRISLGLGGDLPMSGSGSAVELGVYAGRWLMRSAGGPWKPLLEGSTLTIAGRGFLVGPGQYQLFQGD